VGHEVVVDIHIKELGEAGRSFRGMDPGRGGDVVLSLKPPDIEKEVDRDQIVP
jgi:hypothetical protein